MEEGDDEYYGDEGHGGEAVDDEEDEQFVEQAGKHVAACAPAGPPGAVIRTSYLGMKGLRTCHAPCMHADAGTSLRPLPTTPCRAVRARLQLPV